MASKISLILNKDKFADFVDKLQDLSSISDTIKLKIDSDNILAYSMLANEVAVLSLKNYLLNTSDYIDNFKLDNTLDYVITGASKFVKNLRFFTSSQIKMDVIYKDVENDISHVRSVIYTNGKLKISCIGGELSKIRDISKTVLATRLDVKSSKWGFKISKSDFNDVKKLSSINSDDKVITVALDSNKVSIMEESKWELDIDEVEYQNTKIIFNKKYLSNINESELIYFKIFETFILVKDDISNLMLSFETDFSED